MNTKYLFVGGPLHMCYVPVQEDLSQYRVRPIPPVSFTTAFASYIPPRLSGQEEDVVYERREFSADGNTYRWFILVGMQISDAFRLLSSPPFEDKDPGKADLLKRQVAGYLRILFQHAVKQVAKELEPDMPDRQAASLSISVDVWSVADELISLIRSKTNP